MKNTYRLFPLFYPPSPTLRYLPLRYTCTACGTNVHLHSICSNILHIIPTNSLCKNGTSFGNSKYKICSPFFENV